MICYDDPININVYFLCFSSKNYEKMKGESCAMIVAARVKMAAAHVRKPLVIKQIWAKDTPGDRDLQFIQTVGRVMREMSLCFF